MLSAPAARVINAAFSAGRERLGRRIDIDGAGGHMAPATLGHNVPSVPPGARSPDVISAADRASHRRGRSDDRREHQTEGAVVEVANKRPAKAFAFLGSKSRNRWNLYQYLTLLLLQHCRRVVQMFAAQVAFIPRRHRLSLPGGRSRIGGTKLDVAIGTGRRSAGSTLRPRRSNACDGR